MAVTSYHKVTLDKGQLLGETLLLGIVRCSVDLVVVVVETGDVASGELCNLTGWAANTAANIEHLHALLDANAVGQVVLVAGNGLVEGLAGGEAAEVEGLAPAVLVQIGGQVVVVPRQSGILGCSRLFASSLASRFNSNSFWLRRHKRVFSSPLVLLLEMGRLEITHGTLLGSLVLGGLVVPVLEILVHSGLFGISALGEHGRNASLGLGRVAVHGLVEGGISGLVLLLESSGSHVELEVELKD